VVRFGVAGGLWMAGFGTMSLFYAHLASLAIVAALSLRLVAQYYDMRLMFSGPFGDESARHTLWAGLAVLPSNIVARLFGDAPQIVLNAWIPGTAGATAAALFVIARKISSVVQLVRTAFSYVLAPLASHAAQSGDDSVQSIYGFATRVSLAVTLPLGVGLIAGAKPILSAFAPGAEVAVVALILLTMGRMVEAIAGNASPIQQVIGGYRGQIFGGLAGLAMSLVIVGLTMPQGGLNGISLAVCCGLSVSALLPMWQLSHYEKLHPFERPFGTVVLRSAIIAAIALGVGLVLSGLPIAIAIVAIVAVQLASIWLSLRAALPLEDRQALGKVGRVLRLS
jgi:O-antigen/teichoic acid export membrane protein